MYSGEIKPEVVARAFGEVLRARRLQQGFSQEKLAEATDMDRTYISMLERGIHQPSITAFLRLAHALGTPPGDMLDAVVKKAVPDQ